MSFRAICATVTTVFLCANSAQAQPSSNSSANWVIAGPVHAVARTGSTVYVGGQFNGISPKSQQIGAFGMFQPFPARRSCHVPPVSGSVSAITFDGFGGFFVAGRFDRVGNSDRQNIVHITPSCGIDSTWSGIVNGRVNTMTLAAGVLYVGGLFTQAGQQGGGTAARTNLAAFLASNGVIQTWNPTTDGEVHTMDAVSYLSGSTIVTNIFIGGAFTQVAGAPRQRLAALDAAGAVTTFVADADAAVLTLDAEPAPSGAPSRVWVGGEFTTIAGESRDRLALINVSDNSVDAAFNPGANARVRALVATGTSASNMTVYVGGDFTQMGGAARNYVGAVGNSGVALPFAPNPDGPVYALAVDNPSFPIGVYIGGRFTQLSGVTRLNAGRVHPTSNVAEDWDPAFNGDVRALAVTSSFAPRVAVGGAFDAIAAQRRHNLAAFNLDTGRLIAWQPAVNDTVRALDIRNDVLYVGGDFTQVDSEGRSRLAAFNLTTHALNTWDPVANESVLSLIWSGDTVFAGGDFTTIGGSTRVRLAGIHATTGAVTSWSPPSFDATVHALALQDTSLYVAGSFAAVGGAPTPYLVRVDSTTGSHDLTWAPMPDGAVRALCVQDSLVYAGGTFSLVGALARTNLAAISTTTGLATAWQPDPNGAVDALSCSSALIYAGGAFTSVGTAAAQQDSPRLAALLPSASGASASYTTGFRARNLGVVRSVLQAFDGVIAVGSGESSTDETEPVARLAFFAENFAGAPGAPTNPSVVTISGTTRFRFSPPTRGPRPTRYLLEAGTGLGLANLAGGVPIDDTQFEFTGIPPGTYYVRFRAVNSAGIGAPSEDIIVTIGPPFVLGSCIAPPDPPQDFVASVTGFLINLSWAPGSGETLNGYRLEASTASGGAEFVFPFASSQTSFQVNGPPGVFYARVRSTGACGISGSSPEAILVVGGVAAPPSAPRNFTATLGASNAVSFTWTAPASGTATSYRLEAGTGFGLTDIASLVVGGTSFNVANVPSGTYYLRLYALGATGMGPASDELILVVPATGSTSLYASSSRTVANASKAGS